MTFFAQEHRRRSQDEATAVGEASRAEQSTDRCVAAPPGPAAEGSPTTQPAARGGAAASPGETRSRPRPPGSSGRPGGLTAAVGASQDRSAGWLSTQGTMVLAGAIAALTYLALWSLDLVSDAPPWIFLALLAGGLGLGLARERWRPTAGRPVDPRWWIPVSMLLLTGAIYTTGWGPTLTIGYMYIVADQLRLSGSRVTRLTLLWATLGIILGQAGIAMGVVPSLIPAPMVHGLAVLAALGLVFAIHLAAASTAEKERVQKTLSQSEARFRSLVHKSSDVITVLDAEGRIVFESPAVERIFGYRPEQRLGAYGLSYIDPTERAVTLSVFYEVLSQPDSCRTVQVRSRTVDGASRWVDISLTNLLHDPNVRGVVANYRDITERKALEEELTRLAFHDSLTNLANRALFKDRLTQALARAQRCDAPLAVLYLDLDDFKMINDSLGHSEGDRLLVAVAERLRACLRTTDTAARLGGDEFALLLEEASDLDRVTSVAGRILATLEEPFCLRSKEVFVGASLGIALSTSAGEDADELLRNADVAMYTAKARGKGRYELYQPSMHAAALERLELEADLRRAVERQEFVLHYQPIVMLQDGRITALEALVRWQHPSRGLLSPMEFIPLAEQTGLIIPVGRWILRQACQQARLWQDLHADEPPLAVSVNLSARQLQDPGLVGDVTTALGDADLAPRDLVLEITESVLMHDSEATLARLRELKALGVRLAIDDFGTGYSSLGYLRRFPVDILKIDKSFINGVGCWSDEAALARAIIELGRTLHLEAIAEGIELVEQREQLQALGCTLGQGFYFARPLETNDVAQLLAESRRATPPTGPEVAANGRP